MPEDSSSRFVFVDARSGSTRSGCFLCDLISSFRFVFLDPENENTCLCSPNVQNRTGFFSLWESDGPSRQIVAQKSTTWVIRFSNRKKGIVSKFKMLSTQASRSRMIDELDVDTATLLRARRVVGGRRVSPWRDYSRLAWARGKCTRRAPVRECVLVDYRSSSPSDSQSACWVPTLHSVDIQSSKTP